MIHSMTGYAAASRDLGSAVLNFEIKSVNSRYLDIGFRIGEDLRFLEMALRERISERVGRGKIEVRGYLQSQTGQGGGARRQTPDASMLAELGRLQDEVRQTLPQAAPLSVAEVLRWPGVLADDALSAEQLQVAGLELFSGLLDEFVASRNREGAKLADVLRDERRSVLFSSHNTHDVEQLADHIAFLHGGRLVARADKESFLDNWRRVLCLGDLPPALAQWSEVAQVRHSGSQIEVKVRAWREDLPERLAAQGLNVQRVDPMALEDIFVTAVRAGGAA